MTKHPPVLNVRTTVSERDDGITDEPSRFKRLSSKFFLTGHGVKGGYRTGVVRPFGVPHPYLIL